MESEKAFIGCVLLSNGDVDPRYLKLPKTFFSDTQLQQVWEAVLKLKGNTIDLVTTATQLKKMGCYGDSMGQVNAEFIAEAMNSVPTETNILYYYNDIIEAYLLKSLKKLKTTDGLVNRILKFNETYVINETRDKFDEMAKLSVGNIFEEPKNELTWTIECVDRDMGRPVPGMFHVVAGEGGIGKSFLTAGMGYAMCDIANCVYFSLEMSKKRFLRNYIRTTLGKTTRDVEVNNFSQDDIARGKIATRKAENSSLIFIDEPDMAKAGLEVNIDNIIKMADEQGVEVVFLDSLSVLTESSDDKTKAEALIAIQIKQWVDRRNSEGSPVTIFLLHHLKGDNSGIAGSTKIGHYAGLTISMKHEDKVAGTIKWEVIKRREHDFCIKTLVRNNGKLVEGGFQ